MTKLRKSLRSTGAEFSATGARVAQQLGAKGDAMLVSGGFLFGSPEAVNVAQQGFRRWDKLDVAVFDATSIDPLWDFRSPPGPEHAAALGNCLEIEGASPAIGPNFMDRVMERQRGRLIPLRCAWVGQSRLCCW